MDLKGTTYWNVFSDIWNFFKKFADVKEDDSYWQELVRESGELCEKYKDCPQGEFCKALTLAVLDEVERIFICDRGEGNL